MKVGRRSVLFVTLALTLGVAAGYGWYQWSDTGKHWRYEDKLASYCDGLIPYAESAVFTGLNTEGLSRDLKHEAGDNSFHSCGVADVRVTFGLIADDAVNSGGFNMLDMLHTNASDYPPVALGGGWQGYTDLRNTGVVLSFANRSASLVVSIVEDASRENPSEARDMGQLAAATARKAAVKWSCDARFGGPIPKVSAPRVRTWPESVAGTCKGVPLEEGTEADWVKESSASSTAPLEECVLGAEAGNGHLSLDASFGPYAQRLRTSSYDSDGFNGLARVRADRAWATASCPGTSVRALFSIDATEYPVRTKSVLLSALRAFAERSAARHGCTDLKLPD